MDTEGLIAWLARTPNATGHPELARQLEKAGLFELRDQVLRGEDPTTELEALYFEAVRDLDPDLYAGAGLERQILEMADRLGSWSWKTERYQQLARRQPASLAALEHELRSLWQGYVDTEIDPGQVTLESVVFHRLLKRGFEAWFLALSQARGGDWDEALGLAEEANRVLVAVGQAQEQLFSRTGTLGFQSEA